MTDDPLTDFRQITEADTAEFLGVDCRTLQKFRREGGGPRYVRISRSCLRYRVADLLAWQESRLHASTAEERAA